MAAFIEQVNSATGYFPAELDLGGGLGIRYTDNDRIAPLSEKGGSVLREWQEKQLDLEYIY